MILWNYWSLPFDLAPTFFTGTFLFVNKKQAGIGQHTNASTQYPPPSARKEIKITDKSRYSSASDLLRKITPPTHSFQVKNAGRSHKNSAVHVIIYTSSSGHFGSASMNAWP